MKTLIFSFLMMGLFGSLAVQADPVRALCSTTIKCANGTATCTADPQQSGGTSLEAASCGAVSGKYRSCKYTASMESRNDIVKRERFVCCNANGDAVSFSERASVDESCASPGVVQ
ncbi:hypothetical protein AZI87_08070 [Bdellovibrio bacteriovorus]|uniref:Secreted protein n=1 Tax=Bdellovibrio bacteriovorus TaxID=959 RepID=A0A162GXJ7_BDEBC|nr:hypothetical protein [Bdellovibrio bacteriovorus]KYG69161.1 hypothetical protein AZI87_08070 [Bdellovibrio bacteriovorus]